MHVGRAHPLAYMGRNDQPRRFHERKTVPHEDVDGGDPSTERE